MLKHYLLHNAPFKEWILTPFGSPIIVTLLMLNAVTYMSLTSDDRTVISLHLGNIHLLTGFAAAKVNIKINPSNRCPLHWASFSARMKHKMRGSQHPGKAWPMKIKVTSSSIILGDVTYPHRVPCLWKYLLPRTDPERYYHWLKKKYKLRKKKDVVIISVWVCFKKSCK